MENQQNVQMQNQQPVDECRLFMRARYAFFGGAAALYALFYTFCLYKNTSGITYPFFVAGTLCCFYLCIRKSGVPSGRQDSGEKEAGKVTFAWKRGSLFYLVSLMLLGISVFLTDNGYINTITGFGIVLLFISLMIHQYVDDDGWNFSKYLYVTGQIVIETIASLGYPVSDGNAWFREREKTGRLGKGRYVILGVLILIPLLVVILALLASADAVFYDIFCQLFEKINIRDGIGICLMIICVFFAFYSFIAMLNRHLISAECRENRNQEPVLAITVTSVLAAVYLFFCGIQIVYLFFGKGGLPEGYTYASYARQGFFQLLAVCIINLIIVLVCLAFFRESKVLKGILAVISLCTYIMVASSAYRMILYIRMKHLTFLRILVLWGLVVIALILAGIIASIFRSRFRLFRYVTVVVTVSYIFLAFLKPDYWIAKYNMEFVDRGERTEQILSHGDPEQVAGLWDYNEYDDFRYLSGLSADAAPVLASAENYEFLTGDSVESYGTNWMERYYRELAEKAEECGIRTFNLSRYIGGRMLEKQAGISEK